MRQNVGCSCLCAILNRWMCASFDRLPLDYTLGEMRSGADRGVAVEAAILRVCVCHSPAEPRATISCGVCVILWSLNACTVE